MHSCSMFHCIDKLVANFVYLLFGAGQLAFGEFLELLQLQMETMVKVNKNIKVAGRKTKTKRMLKCLVDLGGTAELGDNSLWSH